MKSYSSSLPPRFVSTRSSLLLVSPWDQQKHSPGIYFALNYWCELILCSWTQFLCLCCCARCRTLDEGRCVTDCSKGKYQSGGQCHLCDHTCSTCVDAGPASCTSCENGEGGRCADGWVLLLSTMSGACSAKVSLHCHFLTQNCLYLLNKRGS